MKNRIEYKSTIKSRPFFYIETKKVAHLIWQGFDFDKIKVMSLSENIFQVKTEARKKEIASIITKRLKSLDNYLINKIANSDPATSKLIVLYSILKEDRLFFEFMYEVYREKMIYKDNFLTDKDFNIFFESKKQQSEKVASWDDYTIYKLKQVYIRILSESGLLKNQKGDRELDKVYLDNEVKQHLNDIGDQIYIDILVGE
jgi:hypothetical protein